MLKPVNFPWEQFKEGSIPQIVVESVDLVGAHRVGATYEMVGAEVPNVDVVFGVGFYFLDSQGKPRGIIRYILTDGRPHYVVVDYARDLNQGDWQLIEAAVTKFAREAMGYGS